MEILLHSATPQGSGQFDVSLHFHIVRASQQWKVGSIQPLQGAVSSGHHSVHFYIGGLVGSGTPVHCHTVEEWAVELLLYTATIGMPVHTHGPRAVRQCTEGSTCPLSSAVHRRMDPTTGAPSMQNEGSTAQNSENWGFCIGGGQGKQWLGDHALARRPLLPPVSYRRMPPRRRIPSRQQCTPLTPCTPMAKASSPGRPCPAWQPLEGDNG